jgi:hypothetical protein
MGWKLLGVMNVLIAMVAIFGTGSSHSILGVIAVAMTVPATAGVFLYAYGKAVDVRFWRIFSWLFAADSVGIVTFFIVRSIEVGSRHNPLAVAFLLAFVIGCQFFTWLALHRLSNPHRVDRLAEAVRVARISTDRRPPVTISSQIGAGAKRQTQAVNLRLNYKRGFLLRMGLLVMALGLAGALVAQTPFEGRRGVIRLMVSILGPQGMQAFFAVVSLLLILGGLRYLWLAFGGLAAEICARGIFLRSTYYTGLLPWAVVRGVDIRPLTGWGDRPILVIEHNDQAGFLLRLIGLGDKVAVQCKLLDADEEAIEAWMEAARNRGRPVRTDDHAPAVATARPEFGRRRSHPS